MRSLLVVTLGNVIVFALLPAGSFGSATCCFVFFEVAAGLFVRKVSINRSCALAKRKHAER
jgi:hypothetical protein